MAQSELSKAQQAQAWPSNLQYRNRETGKPYIPHSDDELRFVTSDAPLNVLAKGGEGAGKSTAGSIKTLERVRRGMSGILVSPDFEHFKKSLWPEFVRWCPVECVVEHQRYRLSESWEAAKQFELFLTSQDGDIVTLYCGGIDDPSSWEGGNVSFAHFDEARRKTNADALKVLAGRVRIAGKHGEPPQLYLTSTPRKHWLFDYFGPLITDDPLESFKRDATVITLRTEDNERAGNLAQGYTIKRGASLTESERRVLLDAEWEDIDDVSRFLPSILMWDNCKEDLPPLTRNEPLIVALDAAKGRKESVSDCFGLTGITRHPQRHKDVAVRIVKKWQVRAGQKIDYEGTDDNPGPAKFIRMLKREYNLQQVCYDPTELHYFSMEMVKEGVAWFEEIPQGMGTLKRPGRGMFDPQLQDLIIQKRIAHDGNMDLRTHVDNADAKTDAEDRKLRIVKRNEGLKIDLVVCLSMGAGECLRLNL